MTMKQLFAILVLSMFACGISYAADDCATKAVGKDGKPLAGAAKDSFVKKCKADAKDAAKSAKDAAKSDCAAKAVSKDGKPLAGAAKDSFIKKCTADAKPKK
jgi:hypothetical protein